MLLTMGNPANTVSHQKQKGLMMSKEGANQLLAQNDRLGGSSNNVFNNITIVPSTKNHVAHSQQPRVRQEIYQKMTNSNLKADQP